MVDLFNHFVHLNQNAFLQKTKWWQAHIQIFLHPIKTDGYNQVLYIFSSEFHSEVRHNMEIK